MQSYQLSAAAALLKNVFSVLLACLLVSTNWQITDDLREPQQRYAHQQQSSGFSSSSSSSCSSLSCPPQRTIPKQQQQFKPMIVGGAASSRQIALVNEYEYESGKKQQGHR